VAETVTIARPYAEAVFRLAKQDNALELWSGMLKFAASVIENEDIQKCLDNPRLTREHIGSLVLSICAERLNAEGKNFIHVLAENDRLTLLPQIAGLFEELKAQQEGTLEAHVTSAYPMNEAQSKELVAVLEKRYRKKIEPTIAVDPALIGGVKVEIGDQIIEASVHGKLKEMALALKR
jgi:F-type H+-transporting ATPase subunit delta